jgi:hypothetical protein
MKEFLDYSFISIAVFIVFFIYLLIKYYIENKKLMILIYAFGVGYLISHIVSSIIRM